MFSYCFVLCNTQMSNAQPQSQHVIEESINDVPNEDLPSLTSSRKQKSKVWEDFKITMMY